MRLRLGFLIDLGACAGVPLAAFATVRPLEAPQTMGQATGDAQWRNVVAIVSTGHEQEEGFTCRVRTVVDVRNGQWRRTVQCPLFSTARGIDARGAWSEDISGWVHTLDSPEAKTLAVTDRWLHRNGPYFPAGSSVTLNALPAVSRHHQRYQRIAATPRGGRTVTMWLGGPDHLLSRTVMRRSFQIVTVRYSDYRRYDGVMLPGTITSRGGRQSQLRVETVQHYQVLRTLPPGALTRPSDPVADFHVPAAGTQVPFTFSPDGGTLLIPVRINGRGPFPFVLDTGGHAIVTPATAAQLGLHVSGRATGYGAGPGTTMVRFAPVHSIGIGAAQITDQTILVMPLSPLMTNMGLHAPVAGILGLELFDRLAVSVNPAKRRITLRPFAAFHPPAGAIAVPIYFTDDMPLLFARLDGHRGLFGLDTGNGGPLMLFPRWAKRNGIARYYRAGVPEPSGGAGGMFTVHLAFTHSLQIGSLPVPGSLVGALTPPGAGATSNPSEAGNLGMKVWRAFRFTLDYQRQRLYLTPRTHYQPHPAVAAATAGFLAAKFAPTAFEVMRVTPHGPAAKAGLKQGEEIVAVDGIPARTLPSFGLLNRLRRSTPGTVLRLKMRNGRTLAITLVANTAMLRALHPTAHGSSSAKL